MKRLFVIAAIATLATAAQAEEASTTTAAATTTTVAAASGSSTTTLPLPEAPLKKWSFSAVSQIAAETSEMNYSNRKDKSISSTNLLGIGYKIDKDNRVGFKQYFEVSRDGDKGTNTAEISFPVVTYGHTFKGFASSDPIAATLWYYIPAIESAREIQSNGILRLDSEIGWTLSPTISVGYYVSPRQSMTPTETTVTAADGTVSPVFSKTTLLHLLGLYVTANDNMNFYVNSGYRHDWKSSDFSVAREQWHNYLGANFVFGKFTLNPEIDYIVTMPRNGQNVATMSTYNEGNLTYVVTAALAF